MISLSRIILQSTRPSEREEAVSIKKKMENYEFILLIVLQSKILENVNLTSKTLQHKAIDLETARLCLNRAYKNLSELRTNFDKFIDESKCLAQSWGIECQLVPKRLRRTKKFFDELCFDSRIEDPIKNFQITVFNTSLDIITNQLKHRFTSMNKIMERFSFLEPKNLLSLSEDQLSQKVSTIVTKYNTDLSESLLIELLSFRSLMSSNIKQTTTIREIASLWIVEHNTLLSSLPELTTVLQLYLTLPVTSASAERSFSKLKLIKSYLRSTMSQARLSGLAILSIEHQLAQGLDIDAMVDQFLARKKNDG